MQKFLRGALIVTAAGVVVKLLGAIYKPVVSRLFALYDGAEGTLGMGLALVPGATYVILLALTSSSFNVAISRLVAERLAVGDRGGARRTFRISLWVMAALGLAGSLLLFAGGSWLANLVGSPDARWGYWALAPAITAISVSAAFRGWFQGHEQLGPYGVAEVLEQGLRVAVGIGLVALLAPRSLALAAGGYNLGPLVGGLASALYLGFLYWRRRPSEPEPMVGEAPPVRQLVGELFVIALPITLIGALLPLLQQADLFLLSRHFTALGQAAEVTTAQGLLLSALTLVTLPAVFTNGLYLSLVPNLSAAVAQGRTDEVAERIRYSLQLTWLLGLPAAAGLFVLAGPIFSLLFGSPVGGPVLAYLAPATLFLMLQQTSSGALVGLGQAVRLAVHLALGLLVKLALTQALLPPLGVAGASLATGVGLGVAAFLNLWFLGRTLGGSFAWSDLGKPLLATALMAVVASLVGRRGPGGPLPTLLAVALGGLTYGVALLALGGVDRRLAQRLPIVGRFFR